MADLTSGGRETVCLGECGDRARWPSQGRTRPCKEAQIAERRHQLTVIEDIVGSASGNASLADVLRKCLVLAFDLGNAPFQAWVDQELDGYSDDAVLPTYRIGVSAAVKANAMNLAYRYTNVVVPVSAFPEGFHELLSAIDFRQSVGELEEIVSSARTRGDGSVRVNIYVERLGSGRV